MLAILDSLTGGEVLIVLVFALLILGPERLPETARTMGQWLSKLRKMTSGLQSEVRSVMDDPAMKPIRDVGEFVASPRKKLVEFATSAEADADADEAKAAAAAAALAAKQAEATLAAAKAEAEIAASALAEAEQEAEAARSAADAAADEAEVAEEIATETADAEADAVVEGYADEIDAVTAPEPRPGLEPEPASEPVIDDGADEAT